MFYPSGYQSISGGQDLLRHALHIEPHLIGQSERQQRARPSGVNYVAVSRCKAREVMANQTIPFHTAHESRL